MLALAPILLSLRRPEVRVTKMVGLTGVLLAGLASGAAAQDLGTVLDNTARTMGASGLTSVTYSGTAAVANFGQSRTISFGLASTTIRNYTRTIDLAGPASRVTGVASPPQVQGGPSPGAFEQIATPQDTWAEQLEIWLTPWGFLRGAAAGPATLRSQKIDGTAYKVVTWTPPLKAPSGQGYRVVGYINAENVVARVETWVGHPVLGDLHVENIYSNYQDTGGLKVPGRISQKRVGMEVFVAVIGTARANPPDLAQLMASSMAFPRAPAASGDSPRAAAEPASQRLADGVYLITGGYNALAVELRDFVIILGGGENEARGQAILGETKRLVPNKPIKYVVNTHPHFDHAAALPPFAAEGITIIADDPSRYFLERALGSPRTLVGDTLATSRRKPKVEGVVEKLVLGDGTRSIELHHLERFEHSDAMLVAYLPKEKILFTADIDLPEPGQPAGPPLVGLLQNLERLRIDFERYVMVRSPNPDRRVTRADLMALVQQSN
jgi:glyoxylase-like metal-dependent hydrolase (beta-lactamase superfamily II)